MPRSKRQKAQKSRRRPDPEFTRVRAETLGVATSRLFQIFLIVVCLSAIVPALPQWNELKKIESKLEAVKVREAHLAEQHERYRSEKKALEENQFYLESRARDRLHLYRKGEKVVNIKE